jgi:hypothetical protein
MLAQQSGFGKLAYLYGILDDTKQTDDRLRGSRSARKLLWSVVFLIVPC